MPEYVLRNINPELWTQFVSRANREGWPTRALIVALMDGYARGEFAIPEPPPRELPQYGWLRAYYRQTAIQPGFRGLDAEAQWQRLTDVILHSPAAMSHRLLGEVPTARRTEVLRWLELTSNVPVASGLTLRAIAHVGHGPDLKTNRRAFQFEVLGLPLGLQAWIADFNGVWRILRVVNEVQDKEWSEPYATKEDARDALAEAGERLAAHMASR